MTDIYIVRTERNGSGSDKWFWDYGEAIRAFENSKDLHNLASSEFFRLDVDELITEFITDTLDNGADNQPELLDSFFPDRDDITFSELEFRPEGYFYIERLKASTSEYWPYRVDLNGMTNEDGYAVFDDTTETLIGVVVPSSNTPAFKASVNGHEAEQQFINLKAAVIHIATEYNGV